MTAHPLAVRARRRLEVRAAITACSQCSLRDNVRPHPVPFDGPLRPRFIVLGEAPDQTDHRRQTPFTGTHGKTLRRMLRNAHLDASEALLANLVCCNPWGTPAREHIDACHTNLAATLELTDPGTPVLAVGQSALSTLVPGAKMRNQVGSALVVDERPIMPIYHPAYLLRDPTVRPAIKEALERFRSVLTGLPASFFLSTVCAMCPDRAETWDDRQLPFCPKHEGEIRKEANRVARRRKAENRAAQTRMEL